MDPLLVLARPESTTSDDARIENVQYLGSYHWVESETPTIVVPGCPRRWLNKPLPFSVTRDEGQSYLSENEFHVPGRAFVPMMRAVDIVEEKSGKDPFDWPSADFLTNRRCLRKLLRWIDGRADRDFRIDTQLLGSRTVLLSQWEARTTEPSSGNFGYTFERVACSSLPGCEKGHTRIVSYDFSGLKVVLRFNVNAYLPSPAEDAEVDSLASELTHLGLELPQRLNADDAVPDPMSGLRIIHTGSPDIPQDSLLELTTRTEKGVGKFSWAEDYPQLFLSQTPNHYTAVHRDGRFSTIRKRRLGSPEMQRVEERAQPSLKKLRSILQVLHDLVIEHGETGRLSLICVKGILQVFKRNTTDSLLPDEFLTRFR